MPACLPDLGAHERHHGSQQRLTQLLGERGVRRANDADGQATGPQDGERLREARAAEGVEDDVVAGEHVCEVGGGEVDDLVDAESTYLVQIVGVRGRGDVRAQMPGELHDRRAQPAGACVDEHFLAGLDLSEIDEGAPPRRQGDQRNCSGLVQGQGGSLEGDIVLIDRDVFGEGPDA